MLQYGPLKTEVLLQPVSGKALPVLRGEVIRIIQEEGEQCVDFNAFNLHDYKEYLGVSNTRSRNAFRVKKGDIIWSVSSRDRPMFVILEIAETCRTDLLGGRCRARNNDRRGYYVDLLATIDTLSVAAPCGSGDLGWTSNFALRPIRLQVFEAADETLARV